MVTMVQVARMAGVSLSTVSHVVNGTRHVGAGTKRRVLDAIDATGYRQDTLARALRRSRTDSVGLVVSDAGEPAFTEMVHGVEHAVAEHGITLLLANSAEDAERELQAVRSLVERRVDGLILARCGSSSDDLDAYLAAGSPRLVLLDRLRADADVDQVGVDNREVMALLVGRLKEDGHERIVLVAGDTRVPTLLERRQGFVDALSAGELKRCAVLEGRDARGLAQRLRALLAAEGAPTCIVAGSTPLAVTSLSVMKEMGVRTPEDLAFATFDGFAHNDLFSPSITTVVQPAFEMGRTAVDLLLPRIEEAGEECPAARTIRLHQSIDWRESTQDWRA